MEAFKPIYSSISKSVIYDGVFKWHELKIVHTINTKVTGDLFENFFLICKVTSFMTARQADSVSDQKVCAAFF